MIGLQILHRRAKSEKRTNEKLVEVTALPIESGKSDTVTSSGRRPFHIDLIFSTELSKEDTVSSQQLLNC
jgi:hypothetical protein